MTTPIAFVTKYALTLGILKYENTEINDSGYLVARVNPSDKFPSFFGKSDFFTDEKQAIEKAESMRLKKIESLKKQIAKLEKTKF